MLKVGDKVSEGDKILNLESSNQKKKKRFEKRSIEKEIKKNQIKKK